jgi:serine protease Do
MQKDLRVKLRTIALAAAAAISMTFAASAQNGENQGRPLQSLGYGDTLSAFLTVSDDSLQDGSRYKTFTFDGEAGDSVTVSVSSLDFNAHLLLADSTDTIIADDSDGGGLCNAHMTYVLQATGRYIVYATTFYPRDVGEFEVVVNRGNTTPGGTRPCGGFFDTKGTLSVGDSAMGTLGPPDPKLGPSYYQVWRVEVAEGQTVTIDLLSAVFDARLTLYRGFATAIDANDDGAGACNARLVLTGNGHPHSVVMTAGNRDETGPYVLRVQEGALPIIQESQCEG